MAKKKFYGFHSGFAGLLNEFIEHKRSLGYVEDSYFHLTNTSHLSICRKSLKNHIEI